jgi:lysophospholipase L1-like esterase
MHKLLATRAILRSFLTVALLLLLVAMTNRAFAETKNLAVLGSSTAAGTGASQVSRSWVGLLQTWLSKTKRESIINLATPGILSTSALCTQQVSSNLAELVSPTRNVDRALKLGATHLIFAFPSNDTTNGMPAEQTISNLLDMRQCAQSNDKAQVAVMSSLPRDGLTKQQNATIVQIDAAMRKEFGSCYINVRSALADVNNESIRHDLSAGDGVHFNDAGHAIIFNIVKRFMESGQCF